MAISSLVSDGFGQATSHTTICSTEAASSGTSSHPSRVDGRISRSKDVTKKYAALFMVSNLADARLFSRTSTGNNNEWRENLRRKQKSPCTVHFKTLMDVAWCSIAILSAQTLNY
jgi:hypothetical protein